MKFVSETLAIARASRRMTLKQLSARTGMSVTMLSRMEAGTRDVSELDAIKLAEALSYPVKMFYSPLPTGGLGLAGMYHRRLKSAKVGDVKQVEAECLIATIALKRLSNWIEFRADFDFPQPDPEDYEGDPERAAELVRLQWQLPRGPIRDLVGTIERAGVVVIDRDFPVRQMDALFQFAPGIPPIFWINRRKPADRARFSLAHEIGHAVMHREATPGERAEDEANRFASAFLMPKNEFLRSLPRHITIDRLFRLKPIWQCSVAAMAKRACQVHAISEIQYRSIMIQMSKAGMRISEPVEISHSSPRSLRQALISVMQEHEWSVFDLAQALRVPRDLIDSWLGEGAIVFDHSDDDAEIDDAPPPLRLAT